MRLQNGRRWHRLMAWLLLGMAFPTALAAQTVVPDAKPQEVRPRISVDSLKNRKRDLQEAVKQGKKRLQQLNDSLKGLRKDSLTLYADLQEQYRQPAVRAEEWARQMQTLTADCHLMEARRDSLQRALAALDDRQMQLASQRTRLDSVRTAVAVGFVQMGKETLEKPFSKMKLPELMNLKSQCQAFEGCAGVAELMARVDAKAREKAKYDEAEQVVNRRFHADSVSHCMQGLEALHGLSEAQQSEVQSLIGSLRHFAPGRTALREFAEGFAHQRSLGIEGPSDCEDAVACVLEKNDLAQRIREQVIPVPYLKRCYEALRQAIRHNFKQPSKVEKDLLAE